MNTDIIIVAVAKAAMDEDIPKNVQKEKMKLLWKLEAYLQALHKEYWDEVLLEQICEKKIAYLEFAKTITELREIMKPVKPHYNGDRFRDSKYQVDAEELIGWSRASLCALLSGSAMERMEELFERVYSQPLDTFKRENKINGEDKC